MKNTELWGLWLDWLNLIYRLPCLVLNLSPLLALSLQTSNLLNKTKAPNSPDFMAATSTSSLTLPTNAHRTNFPSSTLIKLQKNTQLNFSFSFLSTRITRRESSNTAKYNEIVVDEEIDKIRRLQNGSDVRGVAVEGEKGRTVDLTPPAVEAIAESFGEWVIDGLNKERGGPVEDIRVSLGRDPRISGASLSVAVFAGLARAGCLVFDMELATTPACFMSTLLPPFAFDASIMVWLRPLLAVIMNH